MRAANMLLRRSSSCNAQLEQLLGQWVSPSLTPAITSSSATTSALHSVRNASGSACGVPTLAMRLPMHRALSSHATHLCHGEQHGQHGHSGATYGPSMHSWNRGITTSSASGEKSEDKAAAAAAAAQPSPSVLDRVTAALGPRVTASLTLRANSAWQRHKGKVMGACGVLAVYGTWKLGWAAASGFVSAQETMAQWGVAALAMTAVAAGGQYAAWHYGLSSTGAYHAAMSRLNASPAVLEVLGAPLLGSDLRAHVVTGGGLYLSKKGAFKPKIRSRRLLMLFPLHGSERSGLVSLEVKKKQGRYTFKLLAVDVTSDLTATTSKPVRLYLEGGEATYDRGAVLGALRDPFLKAASLQPALDLEEEAEEEAEEAEVRAHLAAQEAQFNSKAEPAPAEEAVPAAPAAAAPAQQQQKPAPAAAAAAPAPAPPAAKPAAAVPKPAPPAPAAAKPAPAAVAAAPKPAAPKPAPAPAPAPAPKPEVQAPPAAPAVAAAAEGVQEEAKEEKKEEEKKRGWSAFLFGKK